MVASAEDAAAWHMTYKYLPRGEASFGYFWLENAMTPLACSCCNDSEEGSEMVLPPRPPNRRERQLAPAWPTGQHQEPYFGRISFATLSAWEPGWVVVDNRKCLLYKARRVA
ncbi:hypothetical protein Ddc_08716 [Ditylenchus destructor]|nr:hypothetical protein Ddc_08716 [Ditylenchus destructor]